MSSMTLTRRLRAFLPNSSVNLTPKKKQTMISYLYRRTYTYTVVLTELFINEASCVRLRALYSFNNRFISVIVNTTLIYCIEYFTIFTLRVK